MRGSRTCRTDRGQLSYQYLPEPNRNGIVANISDAGRPS